MLSRQHNHILTLHSSDFKALAEAASPLWISLSLLPSLYAGTYSPQFGVHRKWLSMHALRYTTTHWNFACCLRHFPICILLLPDNKNTNFFLIKRKQTQRMNVFVSSHATNINIGLLTPILVLFSYNWEQWTKTLFCLSGTQWLYCCSTLREITLLFVYKVLHLKWSNLIVIIPWGWYFHNFIGEVTYLKKTKLNEVFW